MSFPSHHAPRLDRFRTPTWERVAIVATTLGVIAWLAVAVHLIHSAGASS